MNRELARDNDRAMFVTAFAARLDLATGELEYVNAGHNPTYRLGAAGCAPLGAAVHPALGALEDCAYRAERVRLLPGEALLLYTDGVVEARSAQDEEFQPLRLEAYLREAREARPQELVRGIVERVSEFAGETPQYDDVTVLGVRWLGADAV